LPCTRINAPDALTKRTRTTFAAQISYPQTSTE
jgi:hypothetical protein